MNTIQVFSNFDRTAIDYRLNGGALPSGSSPVLEAVETTTAGQYVALISDSAYLPLLQPFLAVALAAANEALQWEGIEGITPSIHLLRAGQALACAMAEVEEAGEKAAVLTA